MYQRGKNPIGKDGKITRCSSCGSVNHYYRKCPDMDMSKDNEFQANITEKVEEAQIVLYNWLSHNPCDTSFGIIDTACTASLCGEKWLKSYLETLPDQHKNVKKEPCNTRFLFRDEESKVALYRVKVPIELSL